MKVEQRESYVSPLLNNHRFFPHFLLLSLSFDECNPHLLIICAFLVVFVVINILTLGIPQLLSFGTALPRKFPTLGLLGCSEIIQTENIVFNTSLMLSII